MKILADTHLVLWALTGNAKLPDIAESLMSDPQNECFCSVASIWEVAIKHMIKPDKIMMSGSDLAEKAQIAGFKILQIKSSHVVALETIIRPEEAPPHNDPFDRMLIAQAKAEHMLFITHDSLIPQYNEDCIVPV